MPPCSASSFFLPMGQWNSLVVAGFRDGKSFLGLTTMLGVHYSESHVAAGFGSQLARPLFRESQVGRWDWLLGFPPSSYSFFGGREPTRVVSLCTWVCL